MKAVVMAGGEGTRLRPLTSNQPKPMVPVAGKPCMEHIVELVARHGLTQIVATLAYMPQIIRGYFGEGSQLGVEIDYSIEELPAGTAGSVKLLEHYLDDTFLVISGDAITDIDLTALLRAHRESGAAATLALKRVPNPLEFGVVIADEQGRIERFLEKPSWGEIFSDTINTGIYALEPDVLRSVPEGEPFDFSTQLFPALLEAGVPLYGHVVDGYWKDVGNLIQYQEANRDALDGKVNISIAGIKLRDNIWVGEGSLAENLDAIHGPAVIGNYCAIDPTASIGRYTVLGNNVIVKESAATEFSMIDSNCYLGPRSQVRGAVVGKGCEIGAHASVSDGAVVGDECMIGKQSVIAPNVRIYPFKRVDTGATVQSSLIWQPRGPSTLFSDEGATGIVNVEITPETATRLAMAFGTALRRSDRVVASRDAHPASRMIKRAMIAGIVATGVSVEDLRTATGAVNRFEVANSAAPGGFHVQISERDPERIQIMFFESNGMLATDTTRKTIEKLFNRQELRRALLTQLGELAFPPRVTESYVKALAESVDVERVRAARFRIAADYGYSSAGRAMPALLRELRVESFSTHSFTDPDEQAILTADMPEFTSQTRRLVEAMGATFGVVMDQAAERVVLIDERGEEVPSDQALHLVLMLVARRAEKGGKAGGKVVLPANCSRKAERIATAAGLEVVRAGVTRTGMTEAAAEHGVVFAGSPDGAFVFPSFLPGCDAVLTVAKVLELLAFESRPLSELCSEVPRAALIHQRAPVPWSLKGMAMRELGERVKDTRVELSEGIRVEENGAWAQVVPDPYEPLFHIYAEGETGAESAALARRYRAMLEEVLEGA
ncbi:MAG: sugar phosphate nucleotidyltransferase [Solirubrobacterales bacterium]